MSERPGPAGQTRTINPDKTLLRLPLYWVGQEAGRTTQHTVVFLRQLRMGTQLSNNQVAAARVLAIVLAATLVRPRCGLSQSATRWFAAPHSVD